MTDQNQPDNLAVILNSIGEGVIITDDAGRITFLNSQAEKFTGWSLKKALNSSLEEILCLVNAITGEKTDNYVKKVINTGSKVNVFKDVALVSREGDARIITASVSPVPGRGESVSGTVIVISDISEQHRARQELLESEEKFRTLAENSPFSIMIYQDDRWVYVNPAAERITGYSAEELMQMRFWEVVHPEYRHIIRERGRMRQAGKSAPSPYDFKIITGQGEEKWVSLSGDSTWYRGRPAGFIIVVDITDRKKVEEELRQSEERYREIVDTMEDGYYEVDLAGNITFANKASARFMGYPLEEYIGLNFKEICRYPWDVYRKFNQVYSTGKPSHNVTFELMRKDGSIGYGEFSVTPIRDENGSIKGFRGVGRDITERKRYEEKLKYFSMHDQLTGLYNRAFFEEQLQRLKESRNYPISIISADLDGLKLINDTLGHDKGDQMLVGCAEAIKSTLRANDILARVGGDEFAAILPNTDERTGEKVVQRILNRVENYNWYHPQLPLSLSIGKACAEKEDSSLHEAFKEADDLMYRDKMQKGSGARSQIIDSLLTTLGERDFITEGHLRRLEDLCLKTGKKLNLSRKQLSDLALLARVHDLGKVGIPDSILFKKAPLDEEEWEVMRKHPEKGYRIALSSSDLAGISDLILRHHERWDGKGYPLGIEGKDIPLECRILSIVDAYDAMTSDRPYRKALSREEAVKELLRCAGTQFDPGMVEVFLKVLEEELEYKNT